jgi:hypothetical protein
MCGAWVLIEKCNSQLGVRETCLRSQHHHWPDALWKALAEEVTSTMAVTCEAGRRGRHRVEMKGRDEKGDQMATRQRRVSSWRLGMELEVIKGGINEMRFLRNTRLFLAPSSSRRFTTLRISAVRAVTPSSKLTTARVKAEVTMMEVDCEAGQVQWQSTSRPGLSAHPDAAVGAFRANHSHSPPLR